MTLLLAQVILISKNEVNVQWRLVNSMIPSFSFTALHYAALSGDVEVVSALIQMEADPSARDQKGKTLLPLKTFREIFPYVS